MTARPMRADARRKREAILQAAVDLFVERGPDLPLDEVARRAGVGIGTLYRHFPTREALVTGAYLQEINQLCDGADELLAAMPPDEALQTWLQNFARHAAGHPGMADAVKAVVAATDAEAAQASQERLHAIMDRFLDEGRRAGVLRSDVDATDVVSALSGISLANNTPEMLDRANRIIRLVVDGLRHSAEAATQR